ncbi:tRNA glutamyl-Q(34) synthetase GluQRS [Microbulbifer sp. ARAS458-1]|uniref:tRNA glutamyl-Q(34) synthetase GluQRS n=1 Tax=Microbulbifer sp. ARAS458-1 TaxID=3140242 RepID=UPI003877FBD0
MSVPASQPAHYTGRFAPSPTGPLHFGSLVCALGSYLDAIAHGGHWLVRMEDLDPPREMPGAAERILKSLHAHGLHSHSPIVWQSRRHALYQQALDGLRAQDLVYPCSCTREQVRKAGGHRRANCIGEQGPYALRFHCAGATEKFHDIWQGEQIQTVTEDPILKRKDGLYAYQLAVVVDDIAQGVNCVVRGADLLDCSGVQRQLFRALGAEPPEFGHLPLVMNEGGQKLSKQNHAAPLDDDRASENLVLALGFLGFHPPPGLESETPARVLSWASAHWHRKAVDIRNRLLN